MGMKLIITIDTEEDNWARYSPTENSLANIARIPTLQKVFDDFGYRPTYLVTYPVAADKACADILREILERRGCEIGSHCHPWNTPPFDEEMNLRNTMLCNLPRELQFMKMRCLDEKIGEGFGIKPVSFRCGRWGYSTDVAHNLFRLNYRVDTSISAYIDWSAYEGPDFSGVSPRPFRFMADNIFSKASNGPLAEVPATVGYLQGYFPFSNNVSRTLSRKSVRRLRLSSILQRLNILNRVWMSPEFSDADTMIRLAGNMEDNGYSIINMSFHSPNLIGGQTPFVRTRDEEGEFLRRIERFLRFARRERMESITLSESLNYL